MSYQTIDDIPVIATSLTSSDGMEIRQSGVTKQSPLSVLLTYMQNALTFPSVPSLSTILSYVQANLAFPSTSVTPSAPTRALSTTYQNTSGKVLRVTPSIEVSATSLLLTGSKIKVELMSDSATTPTTVRGTVGQSVAGVLSLTNANTIPVSYDVPPNHYYRTLTTQVSGGTSGSSATLVTWTEEVRT